MPKKHLKNSRFYKKYKNQLWVTLLSTVAIVLSFLIFYIFFKNQNTQNATQTTLQAIPNTPTTAVPPVNKATLDSINIGSILDLSGSCAELDTLILKGINLRIDEENKKGGISGHLIKLHPYDHQYERELARKHAETLIKNNINILLGVFETTPLLGCLDLIEKKDILVLFPNSGASSLRRPDLSHLFFLKPSNENEIKTLTEYAIKNMSAKKIVTISVKDKEVSGFIPNILKALLKKQNLPESNWLEILHESNKTNISQKSIDEIKAFNPDTIMFATDTIQAKIFLTKLGNEWLKDKNLLGSSFISTPQMIDMAKSNGLSIVFSHAFPKLQNSSIEVVKEFEQKATANNIPITESSFEGYLYADLLLDVLKQIEFPYTKEKIIQKIESFKNYNFKGLTLNFNPKTRELNNDIWLELPSGEWKLYKNDPTELEQILQKPTPQQDTTSKKEIAIGTILDLTGGASEFGTGLLKGMQLCIDDTNNSGGIKGSRIKLVVKNHEYERHIALAQLKKLIADKIDIILCLADTATLSACMEVIEKKEALVLFPNSGSEQLRKPALPYLVFHRTSYENEFRSLVQYAIKNKGSKKIALFIQNDPELESTIKKIIEEIAKTHGIKDENFSIFSFPRNTANQTDIAKKIKLFNPDCIFTYSDPVPAINLLSNLEASYLSGKTLLGISFVAGENFYKAIKERGLPFIIAHTLPNLKNNDIEIVKEFFNKASGKNMPIIEFTFQGYLYASIFVETLKQIDPPYTKDKIVQKIEAFKNYNFKGLTLNFNSKTRELSNDIWLELPSGEWIYSQVNGDTEQKEILKPTTETPK